MARLAPLPPPGRGRGVQAANVLDFGGGLNLVDDTFKLEPHQSPDLLDVDLDRKGGFRSRRGISDVAAALGDSVAPTNLHTFHRTNGNSYIIAAFNGVGVANARYSYSTGSAFTSIATVTSLTASDARIRAASMNDYLYLQWYAEQPARRWDGTTSTTMTASNPTFQDDLTSPSGTHMPTARTLAVHGGMMWVANTLENGTTYKNRVRWSHPGDAGSWRTDDYIDVDIGFDGDEITALAPFGDHMVVFKKRSVYAIFGYSADTYQVVNVTGSVGAMSQELVTVAPDGVYFVDERRGVHRYDGKGIRYIFENIYPALRDGELTLTRAAIQWWKGRVWLACLYKIDSTSSLSPHTFIFDPAQRGTKDNPGAWTLYSYGMTAGMAEWRSGSDVFFVGTQRHTDSTTGMVSKLDVSTGTAPSGHYKTGWFGGNTFASKKNWRRPEFVLTGGIDSTYTVSVYHDFDGTNAKSTFNLTTDVDAAVLIWGTGLWGTGLWGGGGEYSVIERGQTLGTARAVALKIAVPSQSSDWWVSGLTLKYIPKPIRS